MGRAAAASKKSRFVHRTTDTPYVARHAAKGRLSVVAAYLVYRVAAIRFLKKAAGKVEGAVEKKNVYYAVRRCSKRYILSCGFHKLRTS
jgi:hypothetical protein